MADVKNGQRRVFYYSPDLADRIPVNLAAKFRALQWQTSNKKYYGFEVCKFGRALSLHFTSFIEYSNERTVAALAIVAA